MCWMGRSTCTESRYVDRTWPQPEREVDGADAQRVDAGDPHDLLEPAHPDCVSTVAKHITAESARPAAVGPGAP
jgi:hypothetical protein